MLVGWSEERKGPESTACFSVTLYITFRSKAEETQFLADKSIPGTHDQKMRESYYFQPRIPASNQEARARASPMSTLQRVQLSISREKQLVDVALARSLPLRQLWKATHGGWLRSAIFVVKCH